MPTTLGKNLHRCFSRIKPPPFLISPPPPPPDDDGDYEYDYDRNHTPAATLIKNFNSVYDLTGAAASTKSQPAFFLDDVEVEGCCSSESDSDGDSGATPDMATVYASQRFFFSSPGRSNSIIDSSTSYPSSASSSSDTQPEPESPMKGSIAIPTYSPDPYMDFRRSMQEMVEARDQIDVRANWDYLHQLLRCYLSLNPKTTHKYILGAFADLIVTLISSNACATDPSSAGADFKNNIPRRFM